MLSDAAKAALLRRDDPPPTKKKGADVREAIQGPQDRKGATSGLESATGPFGLDVISLDPTKRPDLASLLPDRGIDDARGSDPLFGNLAGRAQTAAQLRDAASSLDILGASDPTQRQNPADSLNSMLDAFRASTGKTDPTATGGRFVDPKRSQYMDDAGSSDSTTTDSSTKKTENRTVRQKVSDAVVSAADTVKEVGTTVIGYVFDLFTTRFGPPGPWTTPLTAPAALDAAGGDTKAIVDGARAIGRLNGGEYYHPGMPKGRELTSPDGGADAPANAGEAAAQKKLERDLARMLGKEPEHHAPGGKGSVEMPNRDSSFHHEYTIDELKNPIRLDRRAMPGYTNVANPGSGDDGNVGVTPSDKPAVKKQPGVKDPPNPNGLDGSMNPAPPTSNGPSSPSTPHANG
jgi:hypothetical protein